MSSELESVLSRSSSKDQLLEYLAKHPEEIADAVLLSQTTRQPQCWRACWLLFHIFEDQDVRLLSYVDDLIEAIAGKEDGHQRELIKLISRVQLTDEQEGLMFDQCMTIWESVKKIPSVRMMAFRFIVSVVKKYPELAEEVRYVTESDYLESLSPGVLKSVRRQMMDILG